MINMKSMCDRKGLQTNSTTSPVIFIPFLTKCYLPIQIPKFLTSLLFFFLAFRPCKRCGGNDSCHVAKGGIFTWFHMMWQGNPVAEDSGGKQGGCLLCHSFLELLPPLLNRLTSWITTSGTLSEQISLFLNFLPSVLKVDISRTFSFLLFCHLLSDYVVVCYGFFSLQILLVVLIFSCSSTGHH